MKPRIAISAPMTVPMEHLCNVRDLLHNKYDIPNLYISYWDRESQYDQKEFDSADAVIFLLKDFAFEGKEGTVPIGVDAELRQVHKQGKPAFLAYKLKSTGEIKFYTIRFGLGPDGNYQKTFIKALSDTTGDFVNFINGFELIGIDAQTNFEDAYNEVLDRWKKAGFLENTDPIEQVKFPETRRVYAQLIPNPDFPDERLLLML